jgi:hypothetical protein
VPAEQTDAPSVTPLGELVRRATEAGITGLPDEAELTRGQVWPAGEGWVAEVGDGAPVQAGEGTSLFETLPDALTAAFAAITRARESFRARTREAEADGRLAGPIPPWPPAELALWTTAEQKKPWTVSAPPD